MKKYLVASHDAGGAEIVSAYVLENNIDCFYYLGGPAVSIFKGKIPGVVNLSLAQVESLLPSIDTVMMGTSGISNFERIILKKAKEIGKRTISFLDHWVNYEMRFKLDEEVILPAEMWVGDGFAYEIAKQTFPFQTIMQIENPYLKEISQRAKSVQPLNKHNLETLNILYCSQPKILDYGYDEYSALVGYLEYLKERQQDKYEIRIRLHPAEEKSKYDSIIKQYSSSFLIYESQPAEIVEDCLWADWVVGCETMAMVIALKLQRKVFSNIPKGGKASSLPFPEITKLFN